MAGKKITIPQDGDNPMEPQGAAGVNAVDKEADPFEELKAKQLFVPEPPEADPAEDRTIIKADPKKVVAPKKVAVAKGKKQYTPEQLEILAKLRSDSDTRVDIDDFLNSRDQDIFHVPATSVPDGFTVEWKNTHIMGQPINSADATRLEQGGWSPAPAELFPELVPSGYQKSVIERPGMILMIRPAHITEAIRAAELRKATGQLSDKMKQLSSTPDGHMDRVVTTANRNYEAVNVE